jgi:hypothetical protein
MWIPLLLKSLNETEMREMGMKITAEDIYNINRGSLKDAIVHFGGFCTAEIISSKGLILTNHHCGYGSIQSHSSVENNYLKSGYWAKGQSDELANPGLFATMISRIEDVSEAALDGVTDEMSGEERQSAIDKNLDKIKSTTEKADYEEISIKPFYKGNQYFLFVTITYPDVRLVGTPPESIGKFGADTDNWIWPRHTGDFALFRIYAGPDNLPAEYSPDNKPYKPKHHLPISIDGVEEDDFTLVFGFPGRTDQYLPSSAVKQIVYERNPARIDVRAKSLKILDSYMRLDEATRLKYASKFASIANYWKKWIGESQGIEKTGGIERKLTFEEAFTKQVNSKDTWSEDYSHLLPTLHELYGELTPYQLANDYFSEVFGRNVDVMRAAGIAKRLMDVHEAQGEEGFRSYLTRVDNFFKNLYKDFDAEIDKEIFIELMRTYLKNVDESLVSNISRTMGSDIESLANSIYSNSILCSYDKFSELMKLSTEDALSLLEKDPAISWYRQIQHDQNTFVEPKRNAINKAIEENERLYMQAILEVFPERTFYPDANSTLRVSYGKVNGYEPRDAVYYEPVTYLEGVMEKYKPGDYEFDVPAKLIALYDEKDYGEYAENGKMPICFIGSNHTTGGNSGSPAIDAYGNLIGLNFDRVWEGTMSDYNYDESICRNIMVDVRYILFIVDKFAGAGHLIDEMDLVHPKQAKK